MPRQYSDRSEHYHGRKVTLNRLCEDIRLIAFFLPQYHPIPENNRWWGEGFTEWTNVKKAKPLFLGHYQPHIPFDLDYYDLRDPEIRQKQADLAQKYGIYGFCYYHYWFHGRRLLEQPFNEILKSGKPDFPFCLCWANENWTRRWDGLDNEILMKQNYSENDDRQHIQWLINAFRDRRYIKINGKPLLLVYRTELLPNPGRTAEIWREEVQRAGFTDVYLARVESFQSGMDPKTIGFNASVEFAPDRYNWGKRTIINLGIQMLVRLKVLPRSYYNYKTTRYDNLVNNMLSKHEPNYIYFRCVTPAWDNSPRKKDGALIIQGATPGKYKLWLKEIIYRTSVQLRGEERLVFINAWNEWGEGNHLEPDKKWGTSYLEATLEALNLTKMSHTKE